ncbi:MAG: hypothetical protein IPI49_25760 [Myxococcales bacterium]|nr:hypothetical protein [Myxococcales bacterium]HRC56519.1 non-canonical purine NTP pyrophosphatase [Kofleriaceae bacterium]
MRLAFLDGNDVRATEIRRIAPELDFELVSLPTAYSTSAPEPGQRARGKVLASDAPACFAEAVDLTTMDGKSLRLELDSENENRFCRWWRETPVRMVLAVALRHQASGEVIVLSSEVPGTIAEKPAGPAHAGWDRLFIPDGASATLAELSASGEPSALRLGPYRQLAALLASRSAS